MLKDFLSYCKSNGIKYTHRELKESKKDIIFEMKYELATVLWGPDAATKVLLQEDNTFQKALSARPIAENMVRNYLSK